MKASPVSLALIVCAIIMVLCVIATLLTFPPAPAIMAPGPTTGVSTAATETPITRTHLIPGATSYANCIAVARVTYPNRAATTYASFCADYNR